MEYQVIYGTPKILAFLHHKDKLNKFKIELITVVCVGEHLKAGGTDLEGQTFEFITVYDTLASMGQELKSCMSSEVLGNLIVPVVEENGGKNDLSMWGHVMQGRVSHVGGKFLSLVSVNGVIFSIDPHWWDWAGEVPPTSVRGRITKWSSKRAGTEQLSIELELGSGDDRYRAGQVTYTQPEEADLSKPSADMGKFPSDTQYEFKLEPYADGTPSPTVVTKEADMVLTAPFYWLDLTSQKQRWSRHTRMPNNALLLLLWSWATRSRCRTSMS